MPNFPRTCESLCHVSVKMLWWQRASTKGAICSTAIVGDESVLTTIIPIKTIQPPLNSTDRGISMSMHGARACFATDSVCEQGTKHWGLAPWGRTVSAYALPWEPSTTQSESHGKAARRSSQTARKLLQDLRGEVKGRPQFQSEVLCGCKAPSYSGS